MIELMTYTIIKKGNAANHPVGTVCYKFRGYDYGLAREDTYATGKPWISMTLNEDGSGPSFTAPVDSLDPQPDSPYIFVGREKP